MESNHYCTLTDAELIEGATKIIGELIETGGKSFTMYVPARPNKDPDLILSEVVYRFQALKEKADKMTECLKAVLLVNEVRPLHDSDLIEDIIEALKECEKKGGMPILEEPILTDEDIDNWNKLTIEEVNQRKEGIEWYRNPEKDNEGKK